MAPNSEHSLAEKDIVLLPVPNKHLGRFFWRRIQDETFRNIHVSWLKSQDLKLWNKFGNCIHCITCEVIPYYDIQPNYISWEIISPLKKINWFWTKTLKFQIPSSLYITDTIHIILYHISCNDMTQYVMVLTNTINLPNIPNWHVMTYNFIFEKI